MPERKQNKHRVPPSNIEAEQSVLGSMLLNPKCVDEAMARLKIDDFYTPQHREIFTVMTELAEEGEPVDLVTVYDKMVKQGREHIGEFEYLSRLSDTVPSLSNISRYIGIVLDKSLLRKLVNVSADTADMCFTGEEKADDILSHAGDAIYKLAATGNSGEIIHIKDAMAESFSRISEAMRSTDGMLGIPTGFPLMDKMLSGLQGSQLIIVAGRPGMGKTSFAMNIIEYVAAIKKKTCLIFSLEMSADQLATRLMCSQARLDSQLIRSGAIKQSDVKQLVKSMKELKSAPIYIDDSASVNVTEIRAKAQRLKRANSLDLIAIDYLQLMQSAGKYENRVQEVTQMTRALKILAKDLNVPIIVLSQLTRAVEKRDKSSRYPMLSDLRESGSIEQDADVVIFLQREDYYPEDRTPENEGKARIIIAKQRNGPTGSIQVAWHGEYTKYEELDFIHEDEEAPYS